MEMLHCNHFDTFFDILTWWSENEATKEHKFVMGLFLSCLLNCPQYIASKKQVQHFVRGGNESVQQ